MNYSIKFIYLFVLISVAACQSSITDSDIRILDKNILGATYVVCETSIKWNGIDLTLEGLEAGKTKQEFTLGKLSYKDDQLRAVNTMALTVDRLFQQMCQSTIALRNQPKALAEYVVRRDKTALDIFDALQKMEEINKKSLNADETISEQRKILNEATSK